MSWWKRVGAPDGDFFSFFTNAPVGSLLEGDGGLGRWDGGPGSGR